MAKNEADQAEDTQAAGASPDGKKKAAKKAKAPKKAEKSASANRGVWGLDLGQCGLKALRLEERGGQVVATHFDYIEHAKILSQPDADKDALIREALETFLKRNTWRGDHLAISVPGKSGLVRFVKLPPVEEKRIKDIVAFEARQQIPFSLEEVVWDFQKLGSGMIIEGMAIDTEIGLFAMKRDAIQRELQSYKDANLEIHTIQMSPLALANYLIYDQLKKDPPSGKLEDDDGSSSSPKCIAALDVGADESTLVVTNGGKTIMQRPVNIGGNHFTRALTKELKLTFAKAEHIKRNAAKGVGKDGPDLKTILVALRPVYTDFVNELQRAFTYFSNTNRSAEITQLVGLGNAFKLPGLQKYLMDKLQMPVALPESFGRLESSEIDSQTTFKDNLLSFAVAYGLGLQGLGKGTLKVNLLPPEIRFERMIKAKKPIAVAAAALLLLGLGGFAYKNYVEAKPFIDTNVKKEVVLATNAKKTVDAGKTAYDGAVKVTDDEKRKVESSVAGQQERLNWLELFTFLNDALPKPDGSNLYTAEAKPYYEGWKVPWTDWQKEIDTAPEPSKTLMRKERDFLAAEWATLFKALPNQLTQLPLTANPLPDQNLSTVHDQYTRAKAAKQDFFRRTTGGRAYDLYANQQGMVRESAEGSNLPAGIADLPQVNIEAVNCRYTDKLDAFWNAAKGEPNFKAGINERVKPASHLKTAPDGAGWVVELRGYTFHWDAQNFLNKTLLENLSAHGVRPTVVARVAGQPPVAVTDSPASAAPAGDSAAAEAGPVPAAGPVVNRVSHVMLYSYAISNTSDRQNLSLVSASLLPGLMGGGGGGGGEGGMGAPGGMPGKGGMMGAMMAGPSPGGGDGGGGAGASGGSKRDSWVSIGGTGGGSAAGGASEGMPGMGGGPGGAGKGGMGGGAKAGPGMMSGAGMMPGGMGAATAGAGRPSNDRRTEFVVFFIWKEPVPSDSLRHVLDGSADAAAPEAGAAGESAKLYSLKADPAAIRPERKLPLQRRQPGLPKEAQPPVPVVEKPLDSAPVPAATPSEATEGAPPPVGTPAVPAVPGVQPPAATKPAGGPASGTIPANPANPGPGNPPPANPRP